MCDRPSINSRSWAATIAIVSELLMLDEPTGLDPLMQEEFLAVVTEYRDRGGTVFLSSHDLRYLSRIRPVLH